MISIKPFILTAVLTLLFLHVAYFSTIPDPILIGANVMIILALIVEWKRSSNRTTAMTLEPAQVNMPTQNEKELEMAMKVQQGLLSFDPPKIPGIALSATCIPATRVGGDFYTFTTIGLDSIYDDKSKIPGITRYTNQDHSKIGILIGDVAGHGISSALVMALSTGLFSLIGANQKTPADAFKKFNNEIYKNIENSQIPYVTAFYGIIDPENRTLTFTSAGHPPILVVKKDGSIHQISTNNIVLGLYESESYDEQQISLDPQDRIIFYTDGITESRNDAEDFFGIDGLERIIHTHLHSPIKTLRNAILNAAKDYESSAEIRDDMTLVIAEIN